MTGQTFFGLHLALHQHLRSNTRVVSTNLPQGIITLHTLEANQGIHDGILEGVPHVQAARHIRWRDTDAVRRTGTGRREVAIGFPMLIPLLFNGVWIVCFVHREGVYAKKKFRAKLYRKNDLNGYKKDHERGHARAHLRWRLVHPLLPRQSSAFHQLDHGYRPRLPDHLQQQ